MVAGPHCVVQGQELWPQPQVELWVQPQVELWVQPQVELWVQPQVELWVQPQVALQGLSLQLVHMSVTWRQKQDS